MKVGDTVIVYMKIEKADDWLDSWCSSMDECVGQLHQVMSFSESHGIHCRCLHDLRHGCSWNFHKNSIVSGDFKVKKSEEILKEWI